MDFVFIYMWSVCNQTLYVQRQHITSNMVSFENIQDNSNKINVLKKD